MQYHIGETPARYKRKATPDSDRMEYRWPASRLTADDMSKLHKLRMQTGTHINVLLHEAVSIMYDLTRSDMAKLHDLHQRTGLSIRELLTQAISLLSDAHSQKPLAQSVEH